MIFEALLANLQSLFHNLGDRCWTKTVLGALASQIAHTFYHLGETVGSLLDAFTIPHDDFQRHSALFLGPVEKIGCRSMNNRERIIDFVGHASSHHAQRR